MKQLVLGILAHVDAGKTTLTEGLLYHGGLLKEVGRVDHKTAYLDTFELERARGITIFSKQARFDWKDIAITLLDTPGHVDFSPEMERVLQVLDYAVLVISAGDGVQSHTRTLWQLLLRHNIPTFLFINKMDLPDTDPSQLMTHLKTELDTGCADFTAEDLFEQVALCEESLFNLYLETGTIPHDTIKSAIQSRHIFPCFFGSALKLDGVDRFLTALSHYMIPLQNEERAMGAQVFKITRDPQGNRLVHLKITSGAIAVKDTIKTDSGEEKINEIRLYSGEKYTTSFSAGVGTICAVTGLSTPNIGDGLGVCPNAHSPTLAPVLTYGISLPKEIDPQVAYLQLKELEEEDPALALRWLADQQKIQIQLMGDVQLDVLRHLVSERFQMEIHFEERTIIYRETISQNEVIEGVGHYEPLCHYAEVLLHLEGGEVGSGIVITSEISCGNLDGNHQNLILSLLENGAHRGVLVGAPLTDLKITLVGGRVHQKHTQGGDLREATHRALRHGLMQATSILLEPWQQISLTLPQDFVGRAMSDIMRMGGSLSEPEYQGELCSLKGSAPVSQLSHYQTTVSSYTAGRGKLSTSFLGYRLCANPSPVLAKSAYSPERDLAHPADSIFCSGGAGFTVPWREVVDHMHLETRLETPIEEEPIQVVRQRATNYTSLLAEDADLLQIFERTYGKIDRQKMIPSTPPKKEKEVEGQDPQKTKFLLNQQRGKEYLLVDGYNIIFAFEDLQKIAQDHLDAARATLLNLMCNYQGFRQCEVIVVFDAYRVKGNTRTVEPYHNITVVYTKEAETADMYIERVTHDLGQRHRVRVATSDGMEQMIILGHGALRVSASTFALELKQMQEAMSRFLS